MGLTGFDLHALAHPLFYDSPERVGDAESRWAAPGTGDGRLTTGHDVWTRVTYGRPLPAQGWKVHVSATPDNAQRILDLTAAICAGRRTDFKYLRSRALLGAFGSKYAHRGSAGKFLALYPTDEADLKDLLGELARALDGFEGPYVLSDLRWNDTSPVFLRYGGFAERWTTGGDGRPVMAIAAPDGTLVPDRRTAAFEIPDWVDVPVFVSERIKEFARTTHVDMPYTDVEPLQFSNGGGVYLATDPATGDKVVLKEARPLAGTDGLGEDAVTRLRREHDVLAALAPTGVVPRVYGYHVLWEHHFLAQEYVEGQTLTEAVLSRHPLRRPDAAAEDLRAHTAWALDIAGQVERALAAVHTRGYVFGDVHSNNVLVRPDGRITLIDAEAAYRRGEARTGLHGAAGFAAPRHTRGTDVDTHALNALKLNLFAPLLALCPLDADKPAQLAAWAHRHFPLPDGYAHRAARHLARARGHEARPHPLADVPPEDRARLIATAIAASATPDRDDRLFPGSPGSTAPGGGTGVQYGAAGVLYALHATGQPVDGAWTDWLLRAVERPPRAGTSGLFDGLHGTATVLDLLGHHDAADALLARAVRQRPHGLGLLTGLPGAGLSLIGFHTRRGEPGHLDAARDIAASVAADLTDRLPQGSGPTAGSAGAALFLTSLYGVTGEAHLLDLAARALRSDVHNAGLLAADGTPGSVSFATGACGTARALRAFLTHRHDDELAAALDRCRAAARTPLAIAPGFLNGLAGQTYTLARLNDPADRDAVTERTGDLWRYAVPCHDGAAFPGDNLMRLSMDFASGSAGVLLSLESSRLGVDLLAPLLAG
ncbi:class III lanthionine synthetase LanKC [Streptomyces sp. NPDC059070]|uniref:class III lanthionine synthetase LanKC n=1 Tax=unclassified Streptomyces TaxID=2593676 RepID=UPI0034E1F668